MMGNVESMDNTKQHRLLEIFFRGLRGEKLYVQKLADAYGVSAKSITRCINELKDFLSEHRELTGNAELHYSYSDKCYRLILDEFLTSKELFAMIEVIIGSRAFSFLLLLTIIDKLRRFSSPTDRHKLNELIRKELYHYPEIHHDCESVQDNLWKIVNCILERREISIEYYRMDRRWVTHRVMPASVLFSDHYFYLIAFAADDAEEQKKPCYYRIDRIKQITVHRNTHDPSEIPAFDEGLLRKRSLFMWPGKLRTIRFTFCGPSVQAVLDTQPTARIIERLGDNRYLIEAEVYGDGIKMWLLSQGSWVKVLAPAELVEEIRGELQKVLDNYSTNSDE